MLSALTVAIVTVASAYAKLGQSTVMGSPISACHDISGHAATDGHTDYRQPVYLPQGRHSRSRVTPLLPQPGSRRLPAQLLRACRRLRAADAPDLQRHAAHRLHKHIRLRQPQSHPPDAGVVRSRHHCASGMLRHRIHRHRQRPTVRSSTASAAITPTAPMAHADSRCSRASPSTK